MAILNKSLEHKTAYVTISIDEYESMKSTIEILKDEELKKQITESKEAIKEGRVKKWNDFLREKGS